MFKTTGLSERQKAELDVCCIKRINHIVKQIAKDVKDPESADGLNITRNVLEAIEESITKVLNK